MYRKELAVIYPITDIQARQLEGGEISLPVTYVSLTAENKNNSITSKFANILDVFLCVSQNAK